MIDINMNEIICADCLDVLKSMPDKSIDLCLTDPPYGINLIPPRGITKSIAGDKNDEARALWAAVIPECYRVMKDDTAALFFSGWSESWVVDVLRSVFTVKDCIVWVKNNFGIGYYTRPQHELAFYCHKGTPAKPDRVESNVWYEDKVQNPIHSCEKPVYLMKRGIELCSRNVDDVVLDPFCGSGTTCVAAKILGRKYIGIEISPVYAEIARKRVEQAQYEEHLFAAK